MKTLANKLCNLVFALTLVLSMNSVFAENGTVKSEIRIGVAQLPVLSEDNKQGLLVDLIQRLSTESKDRTIGVSVYPFKRSLFMLRNNKVDIHFPFIYTPSIEIPGVKFSDLTIYKVPFVLVTNTDEVTFQIDALDSNSVFYQPNLTIETAYSHADAFSYPMIENLCMECAIKKLAKGRIDGVVFAAKEVEKMIVANQFSHLKVQNYRMFDVKFLVQDNETGRQYEQEVTELFRKLYDSGELEEAMGDLLNYDIKGFNSGKS